MKGAHAVKETGHPALVERLAAWALAIDVADISEPALRQAKLLVLDALGCGVAALGETTARAAIDLVRTVGGAPQCSVIGMSEQTSLLNAIIANGVLIRTLDLNDYVVEPGGAIGGHPSDNIPVALAAAEFCGRSGREALAAIVIAYEVYDRFKEAMGPRASWDGVSVSGAAAAIIAGRLMGLDARRLAHALAISLSQCAVSAVVRAGDIAGSKSIANAMVAQDAARAALLARQGVTGPLSILDHPRGMRAVFPEIDGRRALDAPLPEDSYIMHANVKAYPCLATGQGAVAAGLAMHALLKGEVFRLERIKVEMADHPAIAAQQQDPVRIDPRSREAADHSFDFLTAVSLLDGAFGLAQFENQRWNDPQVRALMGRIEMTTSADLARRAPPRCFPCALEAFDSEGVRRVEILSPPGHSQGGLDESVVVEKFQSLAHSRLGRVERERLIDSVLAMDADSPCADVIAPIRSAA